MEATTIVELIALIVGGSGVTGLVVGLLTIRYERRKAKGEARNAENEATSKLQEVYQEMVADQQGYFEKQKSYIEEQQAYIGELKKERNHIKQERDEERKGNNEMRKRLGDTEDEVRQLKNGFARQGREIKSLRPLACYRLSCKERIKNEQPHDEAGSDAVTETETEKKKPTTTRTRKKTKEAKDESDT